MVAHERLTEPRVTMRWPLAKPRSSSNHPAFLNPNGNKKRMYYLSEVEKSGQLLFQVQYNM